MTDQAQLPPPPAHQLPEQIPPPNCTGRATSFFDPKGRRVIDHGGMNARERCPFHQVADRVRGLD